MKKKTVLNIIIGIGLLTYLIYQIWDITQTSKKNTSFRPDFIRACVKKSKVLSLLDSATAYEIATCFYDKFVQKYGREKITEIDKKIAAGDTSFYRIYGEPIFDSCAAPYKQKVKEARYLNGCIHSSPKSKRSETERKAFCNCFMEKVKSKYGNDFEDSVRGDSILKIELIESGCGNILSK